MRLLKQGLELLLVAQREADGQVQTLRARESANGGQARHRRRYMTMQSLEFRRPGRCCEKEKQ